MYNKQSHKLLATYANTCVGVESSRHRELVSKSFGGLTVISGTTLDGKNTLLAGIALHYDPQDCCVVFTESRPEDNILGKVANSFLHYTYGNMSDIDVMLGEMSNLSCNTFFIEQFIPSYHGGVQKDLENLGKLKSWCKITGKEIYICVHAQKSHWRRRYD